MFQRIRQILRQAFHIPIQSTNCVGSTPTLFLSNNCIYEVFQSSFWSAHSTESAILRVLNDIYLSTVSEDTVVLVLLDLSVAFDTIPTLLSRLRSLVGLKASVLKWFQS